MSFQENFQREESENLNFDDTAFIYFAFAMLVVLLLPASYWLVLRPMTTGTMIINTSIKNCQCQGCQKRMRERQQIYRFAFVNHWLLLKVALVAGGWLLAFKCYDAVKDLEEIKGFVPHEILSVEPDAPLSAVKKAYRRLSREKHPDKNPDNPAAVQEFI
jgi:preprotein translocase subunit Sec63